MCQTKENDTLCGLTSELFDAGVDLSSVAWLIVFSEIDIATTSKAISDLLFPPSHRLRLPRNPLATETEQ